jgi:hypothetical protein
MLIQIQIQLGSPIRSQQCASHVMGVVRSRVNAGSTTGSCTRLYSQSARVWYATNGPGAAWPPYRHGL